MGRFLDHITINLTGDNSTRTASAEQVPTSETQQETDVQTGTTAQFIRKLDNEHPVVNLSQLMHQERYLDYQ